jgi:hypothetical protein
VAAPGDAAKTAPAAQAKIEPGRILVRAGRVSKAGDLVTIEGDSGPVVIESGSLGPDTDGARIQAQKVELDLGKQTLHAEGEVRIERSRQVRRSLYNYNRQERRDATDLPVEYGVRSRGADTTVRSVPGRFSRDETFTETFVGRDLKFDGRTRSGVLDGAVVTLATLEISADSIIIEGDTYRAQQIVVRPGGLSPREKEIYGTPPFSVRARQATVVLQRGAAGDPQRARVIVRRAGLYFRNTRILPLPLGLLSPYAYVNLGPVRGGTTYRLIPTVSFSSNDRILVTTRVSVPLGSLGRSRPLSPGESAVSGGVATKTSPANNFSTLNFELGLSARLGFRGGVTLENRSRIGVLALQARRADIITTQLTNRIQLDRKPELSFDSPILPVLSLGSGRRVGAFASASAGSFSERLVGAARPEINSNRLTGTLGLSTRVDNHDGFYADLFATRSRYSFNNLSYTNTGFEVGYQGQLLPQVRGLFSFRNVNLGGATPFRFDTVEIPRELRATFDIQPVPRYLIPIDLRYDLRRSSFRDASVGLLRNYKTFAYGAVYQAARRDLRLEVRTNF